MLNEVLGPRLTKVNIWALDYEKNCQKYGNGSLKHLELKGDKFWATNSLYELQTKNLRKRHGGGATNAILKIQISLSLKLSCLAVLKIQFWKVSHPTHGQEVTQQNLCVGDNHEGPLNNQGKPA
jgi:hypothetical protein